MNIKFVVPGAPKGKERHRSSLNKSTGKMIFYTPAQTAAYERLIRQCYHAAAQAETRFAPAERPLRVEIDAYFAIPKGGTKTVHSLMHENVLRPMKKPDWDNIGKIICDALNGIAYRDDSQIVEAVCRKYYGAFPRVEVRISDAADKPEEKKHAVSPYGFGEAEL